MSICKKRPFTPPPQGYPLRPELVESLMYLYRATSDKSLLAIGEDVLRSIQHSTRTPCGYATVKDTRDHRLEDRMESFFLAETTKYLYLLFDPDNFIHGKGNSGKVHEVAGRTCVLDTGAYIFNSEAHPIDVGAFDCCNGPSDEDIWKDIWLPSNKVRINEGHIEKSPFRYVSEPLSPTCMAPTFSDFIGIDVRRSILYPADELIYQQEGKSYTFEEARKQDQPKNESLYFSLLTCSAALHREKLCINGEVCEIWRGRLTYALHSIQNKLLMFLSNFAHL